MGEEMRIPIVAALCIACCFIIAGLPAAGYNSFNESAENAFSLSIPASEDVQAELGQEVGENWSIYFEKILPGSIDNETSSSDSVDASRYRIDQLQIVDYWGHLYPCNGKCVFLHDVARMIAIPSKRGLLKVYERNPDNSTVGSRYIPVSANRKYNMYFIGDSIDLHTLWFTVTDRFGGSTRSNNVTFKVMINNCSPIANCSPTFNCNYSATQSKPYFSSETS